MAGHAPHPQAACGRLGAHHWGAELAAEVCQCRGCLVHAGLLDALHNETPPSEPAMSPTNKLHAAYEPISEAELLADGLIEPVSIPCSSLCYHTALLTFPSIPPAY